MRPDAESRCPPADAAREDTMLNGGMSLLPHVGRKETGRGESTGRKLVKAVRSRCCKRTPRQLVLKYLPFISVITTYKPKEYLLRDVIAGASVSILHFSQGLGYSVLAGLPPVYGIYVSILHPLIYFFFGTSRHMSVGTMSLTSILVGAVIARESDFAFRTQPTSAAAARTRETNGTDEVAVAVGERINSYANFSLGGTNVSGRDGWLGSLGNISAAQTDEAELVFRLQTAAALSLGVGIFQMLLGLVRFGFITSYLSPPFVGGFTCAAAFHIASSQARFAFFGKEAHIRSSYGPLKIFKLWYDVLATMGAANWLCALCFFLSCGLLLGVKQGVNKNPKLRRKLYIPVPIDLIVVTIAILFSRFLNFEHVPTESRGVYVIGLMPPGFSAPSLPKLDRMANILADAFAIAVINYLFNYSIGTFFKEKYKYNMDNNQELLASGILHAVSSTFSCFPGAASPPRSFVQDASGGKTQVSSLVSCLILTLILYFLGPYVQHLPFAVVAALVVISVKRLVLQLRDLKRLWESDKIDCCVWIVAFLAVIGLDIDYGMMAGIFFNLLVIPLRFQMRKVRTSELICTSDSSLLSGDNPTPRNIVVLEYEAPLLYANADRFRYSVVKLVSTVTSRNQKGGDAEADLPMAVTRAIVDCSRINNVDSTGIKALQKLRTDLAAVGCELSLVCCSRSFKEKLSQCLLEMPFTVYETLTDATAAAAEPKRSRDDVGHPS